METTLHRQLKGLYGIDDAEREITLGKYRIDAIVDELLIEVQAASLSAIRHKIADLVRQYRVLVVKPVVVRSLIVRKAAADGDVLSARYSPKTHHPCDLFADFVHFARVFPHPNLTLEVLWIEQEEHRIPRTSSRWRKNYRVADRRLREVIDRHRLVSASDLLRYLPENLPGTFTTADLASAAGMPRWLAQKTAYSLKMSGALEAVGKQRNAVVYRVLKSRRLRRAA